MRNQLDLDFTQTSLLAAWASIPVDLYEAQAEALVTG